MRGHDQPTGLETALVDACVLVIDDSPANVMLLERMLRGAGVSAVHGLTDARLAVDRCLQLQPDVILLDLHMPHLDGYAVMAALRDVLPVGTFLPVLVLTADVSREARERALDAGARDFITKPFDRVETLQRIRNLVETRILFRAVQGHNDVLRAELHRRVQAEERRDADRLVRRTRIEGLLAGQPVRMVFQPIADLHGGRTVGAEALARFDAEPLRPPNEWFAEAAAIGLGLELELAAVSAALRQLERLPSDTFMSVNVSPTTALSPELHAVIAASRGDRVVLELTEHSRVEDYEPLLAALGVLRAQGVRIAVDDAGAGYAGLQHLLRLRPDIIKLDLELTRRIDQDPARRALAGALVTFSREIGAVIAAEGIETRDELVTLQGLGVPWGQGFRLARPGPVPVAGRVLPPD